MGAGFGHDAFFDMMMLSDRAFAFAVKHIRLSEYIEKRTSYRYVLDNDTHVFPCPFCDGDHNLYVNDAIGKFWCSKCNRSGNIYDFILQYDKIDKKAAVSRIVGFYEGVDPIPPDSKELKVLDDSVLIGIITALPEEYAAMKLLLKNIRERTFELEKQNAGNQYIIGEIATKDGGVHNICLAMLPKMGNNFAAIIATKMQNHFKCMRNIIVSGIAGGVPHAVRLGDVVVSTKGVLQYDFGKESDSQFIIRGNESDCSYFLIQAVNQIIADELTGTANWRDHIISIINSSKNFVRPSAEIDEYYLCGTKRAVKKKRPPSGTPSLYQGIVGSANVVQKNPCKRDKLFYDHNVIAIEMEGSGIKDATNIEGGGCLVVRGVCDYCDMTKNDVWHNYAAAVAASFTYAIIESLSTKNIN